MEYGFRALMEFLNQRNITEADSPQIPKSSAPIPKPRPEAPQYDTTTMDLYRDYISSQDHGTDVVIGKGGELGDTGEPFRQTDHTVVPVPKIRGGYPKSAHVSIYQPPK